MMLHAKIIIWLPGNTSTLKKQCPLQAINVWQPVHGGGVFMRPSNNRPPVTDLALRNSACHARVKVPVPVAKLLK